MKKLLAAATTVALALGLALVSAVAPASAHTPTVSSTCSTLTVKMVSYETSTGNATPNNVKVYIDNKLVDDKNFGVSFGPKDYSYATSNVAHEYKVVIDAKDTAYDKTFAGKSSPCTTTVTPGQVTFAQPACTGPGTYGAGSYSIPSTTGVQYSSKVGSAAFANVGTGTFPAAAGSTVTVKATAKANYTLSGTSEWSKTFVVPTGGCTIKATPAEPKVTKITSCDAPGSIVLGGGTGVVYTWVTGGPTMTEGPYKIVATPATGYFFTGPSSVTYEGTLGELSQCVSAKEPKAVAQSCVVDPTTKAGSFVSGSIEVFGATGISYTIHNENGTSKDITLTDGVTKLVPGSYTVTAKATSGHTIIGKTSWPLTVGSAAACGELPEFALVSGGATAVDQQCSGGTGYIEVQQDPALSYSIGSTVLTSAKTEMKPGTYTVTATVTDPAHSYDGTPSWVLTVAAASAICGDLTTLALTGGVAGIAYLSLAALLLMAGGFVVLRARARRAA